MKLKLIKSDLMITDRARAMITAAIISTSVTLSGCSGNVFGDPSAGASDASVADEKPAQVEESSADQSVDEGTQEGSDGNEGQTGTEESQNGENFADNGNESALTDSVEGENSSLESVEGNADNSTEVSESNAESGSTDRSQKDMELYENFLNNRATVLVKAENNHGDYWSTDNMKNMDVTLEGLVKGVFDYYSYGDQDSMISLDSIEYAYLDCGNSGQKALVLRLNTPQGNENWQEYIVIKAVDGVLETIYSNVAWRRSSLYFNDSGYIYGDGSGGITYHVFDKSFIDADGQWHHIYLEAATTGILPGEDIYIGGNPYQLPKKAKLDGDYVLLEFDFNDTPADASDNIYTYARVVPDTAYELGEGFRGYYYADIDGDESIYDDSNAIKKLFNDEGLTVYTLDDVDRMVSEKEESLGLTEEVKNAKNVVWQMLDINFDI